MNETWPSRAVDVALLKVMIDLNKLQGLHLDSSTHPTWFHCHFLAFCNWVCLLGFLHRLQQLSIRTESHRIEILTEGSRKEERILGNDDQLFSQLLKVKHPDVDGVDVHLASGHLGQAEETVEQGGLATPCPSNNTHLEMYNVQKKMTKNLPFPQLLSGDWQNWVPKAGDLGTFWWNYLSRMITMSSGQNLSLTFFRVTMPSLGQWYGEVMVPSTWWQALCLCWVGY